GKGPLGNQSGFEHEGKRRPEGRRKSDSHLHHVGLRRGSEGGQGSKERSSQPGGFAKEIIKSNVNRRVRCKALGDFFWWIGRSADDAKSYAASPRRYIEQGTARSTLAHRTCTATVAIDGDYRCREFLPVFRVRLVVPSDCSQRASRSWPLMWPPNPGRHHAVQSLVEKLRRRCQRKTFSLLPELMRPAQRPERRQLLPFVPPSPAISRKQIRDRPLSHSGQLGQMN